MIKSIILNIDESGQNIPNTNSLSLIDWQDMIRFGCTIKQFKAFKKELFNQLPNKYGTVLLGSGDFHHISLPLIERTFIKSNLNSSNNKQAIDIVVFDNHPDNMRYLFGIHCGSWVYHASKLPFVRHIHVLGITSNDISFAHSWENYLSPLYCNKLTYWSMNVKTNWAKRIGLNKAFQHFSTPSELINTFLAQQIDQATPIYLSIDKDVLNSSEVKTNWDQGILSVNHIEHVIDAIKHRIIGSDITGDISIYQYKNRLKKWMSTLDKQPEITADDLNIWQQCHNEVNQRLISKINQL